MRDIRLGNCPLCNHDEILLSPAVAFDEGGPRRMVVTHEGGGLRRDTPGALDLFVCRRCGFTQWFALKPDEIPIGPPFPTRTIKGQPDPGPYR